jgi:catechol 2,3-dioxygenase-like lactoylglutathione lyase family enzyme
MEVDVKLRFIYAPVPDLAAALPFYRDTLGLSEAWREGTDTVAFTVPGNDVQVMVTVHDAGETPGPMYQVDDLAGYLAAHPELPVRFAPREIPDGAVAGVEDPGGNVIYFFDQRPD